MNNKLISGILLALSMPVAHADQQILDDLIVDGSACIGLDCVNGESFGFDTIRIKENNLRIRAVDTSTSASFPTNDWQITFNDSANGGKNKFAIDDIDGGRTPFTIEAGAPSNSLYVEDGGRLGLGTSTPVVDVHIVSGNTPTTRLEQDGSSGFTPQTWDVAGNEAGFFIRDVTNGSTLPLRILPSAPSQALVIDGDGEVGIGAGTTPSAALHVKRTNGTALLKIEETDAGAAGTTEITGENVTVTSTNAINAKRTMFEIANNGQTRFTIDDSSITGSWDIGTDGTERLIFNKSNVTGTEMIIQNDGNVTIAGTLTENSSRHAKQDFEVLDINEVLEKTLAMPLQEWTYKDSLIGTRHYGPFAEDFYAAFGLGQGNDGISTIDMSGVAFAAIQGLNSRLEEKDKLIQALSERLAKIESTLE